MSFLEILSFKNEVESGNDTVWKLKSSASKRHRSRIQVNANKFTIRKNIHKGVMRHRRLYHRMFFLQELQKFFSHFMISTLVFFLTSSKKSFLDKVDIHEFQNFCILEISFYPFWYCLDLFFWIRLQSSKSMFSTKLDFESMCSASQ